MPIDSSIYQSAQPIPINVPNPLDTAQKAMQLSTLGMQQMQMARQMRIQGATQDAYMRNTDAEGNVNKQGVVQDIARQGLGQTALAVGSEFAQQDKAQAEAKSAQADAENKAVGVALPHLEYLNSVPDDQKPTVYHSMMQQLAEKGMPMHKVPAEFSQGWLDSTMGAIKNTPTYLAQQQGQAALAETKAKTAEAWSNVGQGPLKRATEAFGRSSPNATVSNQYADDPAVKSAKSSQVYMNQMLDAYHHPSPYSDEALAMNAMKIKFPGAPDVTSFEEFKNARGATDAMKDYVFHKLQGIKAPGAREDLMRDAFSTYLPNVQTLRGAQKKFYQKAAGQGVPGAADIVAEPGIDDTETEVRALQKELGPYKTPSERGGGMISGLMNKITGSGSEANAASKAPQTQYRAAGSKVSADQVAQYATKHGLTLKGAQSELKGHGYVIGH